MDFPKPVPVTVIAEKINARLVGDSSIMVRGINEIHQVRPGDITFSDLEKYFKKALMSAASVVILNKEAECPPGKALLLCAEPFKAYDQLVRERRPFRPLTQDIDPTAEIDPTAVIEPNVSIGPHVKIGKHSYIQANVSIAEYTIIGDHVTIQSGAMIGTEAFYFKKTPQGYQRWRSGGRVIIGDQVDIGAACTVNKGVSGDTVIGTGTKLDCQVQIGHDVRIGERCLIAAQVGISGNTTIGNDVVLYGQVGITQNIHIGDGAVVLAQSGVNKDIEPGKTYFGSPAIEARAAFREVAALRHLPEFLSNFYRQ
jgi:UDP-3-O-[3-hydroxymyristoyl] glucosamine N-acyltransferase